MRWTLAVASLARHRTRSALAVAGVAIAAALLLDMTMLSSGMRESFRALLLRRGFQIRLAPRGTLPFDTEATIPGAADIMGRLRTITGVSVVSPVLGAAIHIPLADRTITSFAVGNDARVQGDYELVTGRDADSAGDMVANAEFLRATQRGLGDTLRVATGYDPQLRAFSGERRLVIRGEARFFYLSAGQSAVAIPLATLQAMTGAAPQDRVSLFMVKVGNDSLVEPVRRSIQRSESLVDAISTADALSRVDARLRYFRQLGAILATVSLAIGFALVTTLVSVSVNERIGEIAVMRAIGVSRQHVIQQIVVEGAVIGLSGAVLGLALGQVTARWLNSILAHFPGLPAAIDFFLFQGRAVWTALALFLVISIVAGLYPAWRAGSLPIARALREEAVG